MTRKEVSEHLRNHVIYPANKSQIVESCNRMMDVPKEDREWFERNLPDRTYNDVDEVLKALKI